MPKTTLNNQIKLLKVRLNQHSQLYKHNKKHITYMLDIFSMVKPNTTEHLRNLDLKVSNSNHFSKNLMTSAGKLPLRCASGSKK